MGCNELVEAQYAGAKAAVRPIYNALVKATKAFGADVDPAPKRPTSARGDRSSSLSIQPTTATRVDVDSCAARKTLAPIRIAADQKTCGLRGPGGSD